jgi:hypothetical protein
VLVPGNVIRLVDDGQAHTILVRIPKSQLLLPCAGVTQSALAANLVE